MGRGRRESSSSPQGSLLLFVQFRCRLVDVPEMSNQNGLLHFAMSVDRSRCLGRWGWVVVLCCGFGTSTWVVVYLPVPPPVIGTRLLAVQYVLVCISSRLLCLLRTVTLVFLTSSVHRLSVGPRRTFLFLELPDVVFSCGYYLSFYYQNLCFVSAHVDLGKKNLQITVSVICCTFEQLVGSSSSTESSSWHFTGRFSPSAAC